MGRVVYTKDQFIITKVGNGFILQNNNKEFKDGHTHIKSVNMAKILIDCILKEKLPKTRNNYLLSSVIRIAESEKYKDKIKLLMLVRRSKKSEPYRRYA